MATFCESRFAMTFAATILTLYPEMFPGPLGVSLAGRARDEGKWTLDAVQIRDFAIGDAFDLKRVQFAEFRDLLEGERGVVDQPDGCRFGHENLSHVGLGRC